MFAFHTMQIISNTMQRFANEIQVQGHQSAKTKTIYGCVIIHSKLSEKSEKSVCIMELPACTSGNAAGERCLQVLEQHAPSR